MCDTCGCNVTPGNEQLIRAGGKLSKSENGKEAISVLENLLQENDHQAAHNRQHFDHHQVLAINLMSAPGSGKTSLLEATIDALAGEFGIAVIEGDLETENDAKRIRDKNVAAIQISTGSACHLDAHMLHHALHHLDLSAVDIVFIENVGNLVCPASFDLGHHVNVVLLSCAEGDDKPVKYPVMFRAADLMLISKTDLASVFDDFDGQRAERYLRQLANQAPVIKVAARRQTQLQDWLQWLRAQVASHKNDLNEQSQSTIPHSHTHHHAEL